jgi:hypothetical protein
MRNDARPIGEASPASPVGGNESPLGDEALGRQPAVKPERQPHRDAGSGEPEKAHDPVMPPNSSTLKTQI